MRSIYVPKFTFTGKPSWNEKATFPISKQTREAIQLKKKSHRLWISCLDSTGDAALAYFQYARARNKVKSFIRRDKRNHEKKIAEQAKKNQKLFWSHTRRKMKTKQGIAPLFQDKKNKDSLKFEDREKPKFCNTSFQVYLR